MISGNPNTIPLQARVVDFVFNDYMVTFSIKLVWPSNETCVSDWYNTNNLKGSYTVGYFIGEAGAYDVNGVQMEFLKMTTNAIELNRATWPYGFGSECNYPTQYGDDDRSPGGVFTLQSQNNPGMFLNVHVGAWHKTATTKCSYAWLGGYFMIKPHDFDASAGLVDINDIRDETLGIFLFDASTPHSIDCLAGSYLEVGELSDVGDSAYVINTYHLFDTRSTSKVAVFGSVTTYNGGDGVTVNAYSLSSAVNDVTVLLQEDTCVDQETTHAHEYLPYIVATPTTRDSCASGPIVVGGASFTYAPTPKSSHRPTASSGGGNAHPTRYPTPRPTTNDGLGDTETSTKAKDSSLYLAVFLPICLIVLIAVVGYVSKDFIVAAACTEAESSEHGLLNASSGGVEI